MSDWGSIEKLRQDHELDSFDCGKEDLNRFLKRQAVTNPTNTFFFTTQLFYTDIQGSTSGIKTPLQRKPGKYMDVDSNSFVQTLIANTTYSAAYFFNLAQVQPSVTYLYDWEGAWLLQPSITFVRNQWKFRVEYNNLTGRFYAGPGGGIGTLKDKDNLTFRIDYLL